MCNLPQSSEPRLGRWDLKRVVRMAMCSVLVGVVAVVVGPVRRLYGRSHHLQDIANPR